MPQYWPVNRRALLQQGALVLLGTSLGESMSRDVLADESRRRVRCGLLTDLHYADKPPAGSRYYRETLDKLAEASEHFHKAKPDFVVELGDLIDAADSVKIEQKYLTRIHKEIAALPGEKHYVLGNHCVTTLTKEEFLDGVGQRLPHFSFDNGGVHFVVLDACFRNGGQAYGRNNFTWTDAHIPESQVQWLREDLRQTKHQVIVFAHQRLDNKKDYAIKNAKEVRQVLEESGKVLAVFQGHSHKNELQDIGGIHYCTLVAMIEGTGVENNGYSLLDIYDDGTLRLKGFRKQDNYEWQRAAAR